MKKIININLSSRLIPIEDSAYELLKNYLDSLKQHFSREEGGEEIVSDIEDRIAEVFQDKLKKGAHCITDEDVNAMINVMGRPEQLEEETATEPQEKPIDRQTDIPPPETSSPKRLMRDENDEILGGVCSGIAAYFSIDPVIIRIISFLLMWAWGTGLIIYIILWIVLPSGRTVHNRIRKRLYRNPDNKVIGGICSGIAAYLNIDPVVPRIIFALPLLGIIFTSIFHHWLWLPGFFFPLSVGSLPTLIVLYIVLWISVPKALTVAEKLEMRGEKVDLQSITNAMKGSREEKKTESGEPVVFTSSSKNAGVTSAPTSEEIVKGNSIESGTPYFYPSSRRHSSFGEIILLLLKICAYVILSLIMIAFCIGLISLAGGFIGAATFSSLMLPYKGLILNDSLQHTLAWPAILLTLGIPVVAIIWLFIKLITGFRPKTKNVGLSLFILWIIGVICAIWLCISIGRGFRMNYQEATHLTIQQPTGGKLLLSQTPSNVSIGGWNVLGKVIQIGEDTVILKTINLNIQKSKDDSFRVELIRASNGYSVREARTFAENIHLDITQQDSVLYIPNGFSLPKGTPFRNQHVILRVDVPEGKQIRVDDNLEGLKHFRHHWPGQWNWEGDNWEMNDYQNNSWRYNENYKMTPKGLKNTDDLNNENPIPNLPVAPSHDNVNKPYRYKQPSGQKGTGKSASAFSDPGFLSIFNVLKETRLFASGTMFIFSAYTQVLYYRVHQT